MRLFHNCGISAIFVCLAAASSGNLSAAPVAYVYSVTGQFGTVNLASGGFQPLPSPDILVSGLASSPGQPLSALDADVVSNLRTLDPLTGGTLLVGSTNQMLQGIEADLSGKLFAQTGVSFFSLSLATGTATLVGDFGTGLDFDFTQGAFNSAGSLYMIGHSSGESTTSLYKINPRNGAATLVGSNNLLVETVLFSNETLYGFTGTLGSPDAGPIVTLSQLSGAATYLSSQDQALSAVIGAAPQFASVPESATWISSLMGAIVMALIAMKRNRFGWALRGRRAVRF